MSAGFSRAQLIEQGLALGAYLEELLSDTTPAAGAVAADLTAIATALDRPVGTTKADVHRGLEHLRALLAAEIE